MPLHAQVRGACVILVPMAGWTTVYSGGQGRPEALGVPMHLLTLSHVTLSRPPAPSFSHLQNEEWG